MLLIGYVLYRASGFLTRVANTGNAQQSANQRYQQTQNRAEGSIRIDHIPDPRNKRRKKGPIKGGEYIDFEEVD